MFVANRARSWVFLLACSSAMLVAPYAQAQIIEVNVPNPIPGPQGSATAKDPIILKYTQEVFDGKVTKLETKTVTITDLPRRFPGETDAQAIDRKIKTMVKEINAVLGPGRAKAEPYAPDPKKPKITVPGFKVSGLASGKDAKGKVVVPATLVKDPTIQAGNGGRVIQGSGGKLALGGILENSDHVDYAATGLDPDGAPSIVQFGIDGVYVADLNPSAGATDLSVLAALSADLSAHGVLNTFDASARSLTLTPAYDSELFSVYWTSTDPGLPFSGSVFAVPVPEPESWVMMLAGLASFCAWRQRSRNQNAGLVRPIG